MSVAWSRQWNAAVLLPVSVWFCCCRHCVCISSLISIVHSLKRFVQKCWQQSITDFIKEIHFYSHLSCLLLQFYIAFSHTHARTHTHTHTHTRLTAFFPGLPRWAGTRKAKPIWILVKQETVSGSGISWNVCKSAPRSRQITMPAPHHSVFYRLDALPAAQPTASKHWRLL